MERIEQISSTKRYKISNSFDRLSVLPDSILCHILSFLRTKHSVATSILSRRFRFLWTNVPILDLDINYYKRESTYGPFFSEIIHRVLALHNAPFNTFRLSYRDEDNYLTYYQIETWIATAIARKVQKIEICLNDAVGSTLPYCLFTCKTLVHLRLELCDISVALSSKLWFPSLKKLDLYSVKYKGNLTLPYLVSCCPVLEELVIDYVRDMFSCVISSPTIRRLIVYFRIDHYYYYGQSLYSWEINAPGLRSLTIEDSLSDRISAQTLSSLITADIKLSDKVPRRKIVDDNLYSTSVLNFLDRLCNVESLILSIDYKKFDNSALSAVSAVRFHNLTKLELSADWRFISMFLENADNLQVLIIHKVNEYLKCWMEPQQVPTCLLSHLTTIKIYSIRYAELEFTMVRYILMNARVLKRMEIYSRSGIPHYKKRFGLQRISTFQRRSAACELYMH